MQDVLNDTVGFRTKSFHKMLCCGPSTTCRKRQLMDSLLFLTFVRKNQYYLVYIFCSLIFYLSSSLANRLMVLSDGKFTTPTVFLLNNLKKTQI